MKILVKITMMIQIQIPNQIMGVVIVVIKNIDNPLHQILKMKKKMITILMMMKLCNKYRLNNLLTLISN